MINKLKTCFTVAVWFSIVTISNAFADGHMAAIKKWSNGEFSLSALSAKEREKELKWFHDAAKPFAGMTLKVVSEGIPTHVYESKTLTKAFEEITATVKQVFNLFIITSPFIWLVFVCIDLC